MTWRIRDRSTFVDLRRQGRRFRHGPVAVTYLPSLDGPPRVAFAIGRRVGNAVHRNRLRRRLRAVMAELAATGRLPSGAYLVVPEPGAADLAHAGLVASIAATLAPSTDSAQTLEGAP